MSKRRYRKTIKNIVSSIQNNFGCHNVGITLTHWEIIPQNNCLVFHVQLCPGTKRDALFKSAPDVQTTLHLPLFQPFVEKGEIYIAISANPSQNSELLNMFVSEPFKNSNAAFPVALGYNLLGKMIVDDLQQMGHIMYAGATRSGKSTGLICLILSLIVKRQPSEVNLVIFDIGANTLGCFEDIPHLSHAIVKDNNTAIHVIRSVVNEMNRRCDLDRNTLEELPAVVCIIDEFISFIESLESELQDELEKGISNLLRRGLKAKIYIVLATQDPRKRSLKVDVDNVTSRIAFKVAKYQTSLAIINCPGAEKLPGNGAMLYQPRGYSDPIYIQGAYITPDETNYLVENVKAVAQNGMSEKKFIIPDEVPLMTSAFLNGDTCFPSVCKNEADPLMAEIVVWVLRQEHMSAEKIKSQFRIGNRANIIMDRLNFMGIISENMQTSHEKFCHDQLRIFRKK